MSVTKLLDILADDKRRKSIWQAARQKKLNLDGSASNGCAITASEALNAAGFDVNYHFGTQALSDKLIKLGWRKVHSALDLKPGDLIFSKDLNGNRRPDHVYIPVDYPYQSGGRVFIRKFDNYEHRIGWRNVVGSGAFMPPGGGPRIQLSRAQFDYALRAPDATAEPRVIKRVAA